MRQFFLIIAPMFFITACGPKEKEIEVPIEIPEFHSLKKIEQANSVVRRAARSVVRIFNSTGSFGTGSFISPNGLMMTNEHVTGVSNCPQEGCLIELAFNYQSKSKASYTTVFAEPVLISPKLDLSVYQIHKLDDQGQPSVKLSTPDYLSFSKRSGDSLIEEDVYLVGHPHGHLKKWSKGKVYSTSNDWFSSDIYALPGNSGSPMLDKDGKIIGLVHRSQLDATYITKNGYRGATIATHSEAIMDALQIEEQQTLSLTTLEPVSSIGSLVSFEDIEPENYLQYENLYIATNKLPTQNQTALVENVHPFSHQFENQCDDFLARYENEDPLALSTLRQTIENQCLGALRWIDCESNSSSQYLTCPQNREKWIQRIKKANLILRENNIGGDTNQFARQRLSVENRDSWSEGENYKNFIKEISEYSQEIQEETNFGLAYIMSALTGNTKYMDLDLKSYIVKYKAQPGYYRHYQLIIGAANIFKSPKLKKIVKEALNHPETTLDDKLSIEAYAYENDIL